MSTNPAQPLVPTLTVATDSNGNATVVLSVPANTPTQTGIIRATDVTSGNQITGNFVIQQITVGGADARRPAAREYHDHRTRQHALLERRHGDQLHLRRHAAVPGRGEFPAARSRCRGTPVLTSGGAFTTTTNGSCFINLTYVITDATGLTIPAGQLSDRHQPARNEPPRRRRRHGPFTVTPGAIAKNNCVPANTFQFIMTGGMAPYSVVTTSTTSSTSPVLTPQTGIDCRAGRDRQRPDVAVDHDDHRFRHVEPRQSVTVIDRLQRARRHRRRRRRS